MRIAILNILKSGISGGYIKYLNNLLSSFNKSKEIESVLVVLPKFLTSLDQINNTTKISIAYENINPLFPKITRDLDDHLSKFSPDIIFVPTERHIKYRNIPTLSMLQNMEPFSKKDKLNNTYLNIKQEILKRIGNRSLKKSDGIIAISEYVESYLKNVLKIPSKKIRIIKYGIDKKSEDKERPEDIPENFVGQFIFTAGSIRPARGLIDLINSLIILNKKGIKIPLIIAGETITEVKYYKNYLIEVIKQGGIEKLVYWMGKLEKEKMNWLYENCKVFVMTSRVESFGMIAGEAMAHGCISISANNPCLPEIFGNTAFFYSPENSEELADRISQVIEMDSNQSDFYSLEAMRRAEGFSWESCSSKTITFMKQYIKKEQNEQ